MRSKLTTLAELAGTALVTFGFYGWHHWIGEVVGGALLIGGGYVFSAKPPVVKPLASPVEVVNP